MPLPTAKTPAKNDLLDLILLVYGPPKIGKSTFASQAEKALFLPTEPGLNSLEVYQHPVKSWDGMLEACVEIATGKHDFRTVVIDTADNLYGFCVDHVCEKHKIAHPSDLDFGKGYGLVNNEFKRVLTKLAMLPYGLILISHSKDVEVTTRTGKVTKTIPTLPEACRKIVSAMADMILFADTETVAGEKGPVTHRVLRTKPVANYEAGDRTGRLPETIDLSYAEFVKAYNHKSETPAKPKKVA